MSKYEKLWKYIQESDKSQLVLSFEECTGQAFL